MKYILLMTDDYANWQKMTPEQAKAFDEGITAFNEKLRAAGAWVSGEGLDDPSGAHTVRFGGGAPSVSEGPQATGPQQLAGFWIIEAATIEEAATWAKAVPMKSGAIEVRPLVG